MPTDNTKRWDADELEIRGTLPSPEHLATVLCEQGYGLHWDKIPPLLKQLIFKQVNKSRFAIAGLMKKEPGVLSSANAAKILSVEEEGRAGERVGSG